MSQFVVRRPGNDVNSSDFQLVKLNTPGSSNGEAKFWMDGDLKYEIIGLNFRDVSNLYIDHFYFSSFFGGSTDEWAAAADCYTYYTNFRVFT